MEFIPHDMGLLISRAITSAFEEMSDEYFEFYLDKWGNDPDLHIWNTCISPYIIQDHEEEYNHPQFNELEGCCGEFPYHYP